MFTGLITDMGAVTGREMRGDTRFTISCHCDMDGVETGASIACSGACLTVVEKGADWFAVDVSAETLDKTKLGDWQIGSPVNLERPLKVGDELGGHIVSGHVDGVAEIIDVRPEGDSIRYTFQAPTELARYVASKGSVALDGVSLTVNKVEGDTFGVNIIPHTQQMTTFGSTQVGDRVNLEIDVLVRYVARLQEAA